MTDENNNDEILMIDFLRGKLSAEEADELRRRIENEPQLQKLRGNLKNTFATLDLIPSPETPADLADRTLAKIASIERTNAILALQQTHGRSFRPTFSLKELAAVVAIVLVAASLIIPALQMAHERSEQSLCAAQMGQIGSAMQTYAINNKGILPTPEGTSPHWLDNEKDHTRNSSSLFKLLQHRYVNSPVVFQCPAADGPSFTVEPNMTDFPKACHITYSYDYTLGKHRISTLDKNIAEVASAMVILGDQTPLFAGGKFLPEKAKDPVSENHDSRGQNVLYLDGHVMWVTHSNVGVDGDNIFLIQGVSNYTGDEEPTSETDTFLLPAFSGR